MNEKTKKMPSLRGYDGKRLLSYLRKGDYAHAGEAESIQMTLSKYPKNKNRKILDAGCGLGGTADFIQKNGWGTVVGIDIDQNAVKYAKKHYPHLNFYPDDVVNAPHIFNHYKFDLICIFNSFYAFQNQTLALKSLSNIADTKSQLAIFDYSDKPLNNISNKTSICSINIANFNPIKTNEIKFTMSSSGWQILEMKDVSSKYILWYSELLEKITTNKDTIVSQFGQPLYQKAEKTYNTILQALINNTLGGIIVYAEQFD